SRLRRTSLQPLCNRTHRHVPTRDDTKKASRRASAEPDGTYRHGTTPGDTNVRRRGVEQGPALTACLRAERFEPGLHLRDHRQVLLAAVPIEGLFERVDGVPR